MMFKTLTLRQRGPAQAAADGSLTTGGHTAGNTETCLAANRLETALAKTWRNEIDG